MQVICKYYTILYKELERLWILASVRGSIICSPQTQKDGCPTFMVPRRLGCDFTCFYSFIKFIK